MRLFVFLLSVAVLFSLADPLLAAPAAPQPPKLRLLTWPGKVEPAAPRPVQAVRPMRPIAPQAAAQPRPAALPTSIYAPAPPAAAVPPKAPVAPAPQVQALAQATPAAGSYPTARIYSLHRQYGETPDPVTLTPRFFNEASPDLAEPPPPAPRTFTTTGGRVVRAAPVETPSN